MKRYLKTITAVVLAALMTAACQKENFGDATPAGQEVDVTLDLLAPQIGTKSYGDGTTAKTVYVHVYQQDAKGNLTYIQPAAEGVSLKTPSQSLTLSGLKATYSTRLVTGQKYTFVFWAQADNAPYTYNTDAKTITVNYASAKGNDESRDAFYNVLPNVKIEGAYTASVQLARPFAQLNFGAADYEEAKAAGLTVTKATVKLTHAATSLNLLDGTTAGDKTVTFASAALPADPNAVLTAGGKDYKYVAMDYVLVGKSAKTLSDVTLTLTATGTHSATPKFTYSNVPLQANYRTNIVGNLFTSPAEVQIEITPGFGTPDNDVVVENVSSIAAANTAFANGATAVNVTNILSSEETNIVLPKTTNGVSLTLPKVPAGKTVTIKYADGASEGQKPQTLTVNAKSADAITIEAPNTHVELNGVTVGTLTASTSSTTLVVGKDVKITNLNIAQGAAEIYGNVSNVVKGENAGTVTWYAGDVTALSSAVLYADRIVIENDINRTSGTYRISGGRVLTIDLNGHKISSPSMVFRICGAKVDFIGQGEIFETADNGFAPIVIDGSKEDVSDYTVVNIGKDITLRGWTGVFINPTKEGLCYGVKVNCSAKIEKTESFKLDATGVYVNGSIKATEGNVPIVNLEGCRINVKLQGIYAAGFAKWNLKNCDIVAANAAVEIRAGEMVIDGGNYTATADPLTVTPNGNGSTVEGAAIGVSQHTTNLPTSVAIKKGTFSGAYSIWEKDVQDEVARDVIKLSVENGTFNGSVYSQNNTSFIKGGTFSDAPAQDYLAEGYASVTASANPFTYKVVPVENPGEDGEALEVKLKNTSGKVYEIASELSINTSVGSKKSNTLYISKTGGVIPSESFRKDVSESFIVTAGTLTFDGQGTIQGPSGSTSGNGSQAIFVQGGEINIYGNLTIDGGSGSKANHAVTLTSGTANIFGGYFHAGLDKENTSSEVIYMRPAWQKYTYCNIYGGVFETEGDPKYLLNIKDEERARATFKVYGGTFVGFNPADNTAEGEHTNFVAPGYKSVETTYNGKQAWTVVAE